MARGLGVRRLLAKFLVLHCMHGDALAPSLALEKEASAVGSSEDGGVVIFIWWC